MTTLPDALELFAYSEEGGFRDFAGRVLAALQAPGGPAVTGWSVPFGAKARATPPAQALEKLPESDARADGTPSVGFVLGGGADFAAVYRDPDGGRWVVRLHQGVARDGEGFAEQVDGLARLCAGLAASAGVRSAQVDRLGAGGACVPDVPVAGRTRHVVVTTEAEVAAAYDDPAAFWDAGWDETRVPGGARVLVRAREAAGNGAFLAAVYDAQWRMARAARPGLTRYYAPACLPEEHPVFASGEARLLPVGYYADEQSAVYSCQLGPGEHIPGWEIYHVWELVQSRALSDGRPVSAVRVVFADRESAARERRPLLDAGAEVLYLAPSGQYERLVD